MKWKIVRGYSQGITCLWSCSCESHRAAVHGCALASLGSEETHNLLEIVYVIDDHLPELTVRRSVQVIPSPFSIITSV